MTGLEKKKQNSWLSLSMKFYGPTGPTTCKERKHLQLGGRIDNNKPTNDAESTCTIVVFVYMAHSIEVEKESIDSHRFE